MPAPAASVRTTARPVGTPWNTVSQATSMPDADNTLSTPRSIMPTRMTTDSPAATTIRKLEFVKSAVKLPTVGNAGASSAAAAQMMMKKASGRWTLPGRPARAPTNLDQGAVLIEAFLKAAARVGTQFPSATERRRGKQCSLPPGAARLPPTPSLR